MAHEKLSVVDKHNHYLYPSPDTHPVSSAKAARTTPAPPSPPLSSASSPSLLSPSLLQLRHQDSASLPPSILEAFRALHDSERGEYNGPSWLKFTNVSADDLEALEALVSANPKIYFRYDYDPTHELLILRMPEGRPHVYTKNSVQQTIWHHLKARLELAIQEHSRVRVGDGEPGRVEVADALRSMKTAIKPLVEDEIMLPNGAIKRPDIAFDYLGSDYPSFIVEVGHSQKSEELPALARQFIESTNGDIHTVVTVDLGFRERRKRAIQRRLQRQEREQEEREQQQRVTRSRSRQSSSHHPQTTLPQTLPTSLSLYRLGHMVLQDQLVRDTEGQALQGGFELNVADFVPLALADHLVARDILEGLTFTVPFSELCDGLAAGEQQQARQERTPQPEAQTSRKRVHFSWSLPEPEPEAERQSSDSEPSSSKRRKTVVGERLYRGRRSSSGTGAAQDAAAVQDLVVNRTRSKTRSRTRQ